MAIQPPGTQTRQKALGKSISISHSDSSDLFCPSTFLFRASQVVLVAKNPPANASRRKRFGFDPWVGEIPWRRAMQPTQVLLPGESHGQKGLAGYSPWGRTELNATEGLGTHQNAHSCVGQGSSFGSFRCVALSFSTPFISSIFLQGCYISSVMFQASIYI